MNETILKTFLETLHKNPMRAMNRLRSLAKAFGLKIPKGNAFRAEKMEIAQNVVNEIYSVSPLGVLNLEFEKDTLLSYHVD